MRHPQPFAPAQLRFWRCNRIVRPKSPETHGATNSHKLHGNIAVLVRGRALTNRCLNRETKGVSARLLAVATEEAVMGRGILLWLLGVPIPIIILIALLYH
jgi:hypothetical protein